MKLVDILAQELAEWPVKEGVYPPGQDYCVQSDECSQVFFCGTHGKILLYRRADKTSGVRVTRAEWQAAVDALNAPKVVEWDGEGLPPVGSTCEHSTDDNKNDSADGGWKKVKIVGHHQFHNDDYLCAVWVSGTDVSYSSEGEHFRPIRTAEQVAAEEIEAIREFLIYEHRDGGLIGIAKALHESGYRKEPKPCGS